MSRRDDAASVSTSSEGDVADPPEKPRYVEVTDEQDEIVGYLAHWREDEWIWIDEGDTRGWTQ